MNQNYVTVTQLTKYIKYIIDNDIHLNNIYLKGEISNFKRHTRGHLYFTIKDENTRINAIMFVSNASRLKFEPMDGMKVLITGKVSVYESTGAYQIYVSDMVEDGVGNLYVAYEQLKKKLELEGLFDPAKKKKIPKIPKTIGIITAPTGAAIKDILSTIKRRWPIAKTILFPSLVQGAEASGDILRNIELSKNFDLDVLIIGRGGGSIEDLWCFNDEEVARAIYDLDVPVISAVGHEIDFTISDFVADLRAPTPTGAAEMAVPNMNDVISYLSQVEKRMLAGINNIITLKQKKLKSVMDSPIIRNPISIYEVKEQKFDNIYERLILGLRKIVDKNQYDLTLINNKLRNNIVSFLDSNKHDFEKILSKLEVLNPMLTLKRGYAIVKSDDKVIDKKTLLNKGDSITVEMQDGNFEAVVK
ncbi:MAG: exodeoxyribonuclease VII large subunit [Bacilli bacterium]